jgi:hypothetical protein
MRSSSRAAPRAPSLLVALGVASIAASVAAAVAGCGGAPSPSAATTTSQAKPKASVRVVPPPGPAPNVWLASDSYCDKPDAKPPPHAFSGLLRGVRCDEQMFQTMANVSTMLGVSCAYCHVPIAGRTDRLDYVTETPKRTLANWMYQHLMQSVRPADGSRYSCASCHVDEHGKPVAQILGTRDRAGTHEWMLLSLTDRFVTAKGERLRCKSCHVGNETTPAWRPRVLLQTDQLPPHEEPGVLDPLASP